MIFSYSNCEERGKRSSVFVCKGVRGELRMITSCWEHRQGLDNNTLWFCMVVYLYI